MQIARRWIVGLLTLFPLAFLLMLSLGRQWRFPALFPESWTLEHWAFLFSQGSDLGKSLGYSLLLSTLIAFSATFSGMYVSRFVAYSRRGRRWLLLAYLPYTIAPVILATCWQYFFIRLDLSGKYPGVYIAQFLITFPYSVLFFHGFWTEELRATEQLVATLGGSAVDAWKRVILPLAARPLAMGFFQIFLISWFEFGLTTLLGVGKVQTLTVKVFTYVNEANIYLAALSGLLLAFPPVLLLLVNRRVLRIQALDR